MTTTSILSHQHQPPLKTRNPPVFLRTNYYGSVGRPCNGKRKSAVELLQESKAYYVKSESVLDTKQELKNADHLRVRSPTVDDLAILANAKEESVGSHLHLSSSSYAFAGVCPICSPYHYHQCHPYATTTSARGRFGQLELDALEKHYLSHYHRSRKENRENGAGWSCSNRINRSQERRSSVPTSTSTNSFPAAFYLKPLQIQKDILTAANSSGGSSSKSSVGMHSCHSHQEQPLIATASSSLSTHSVSPQQRHSSVSSTSTSSRRRRAAATNTVSASSHVGTSTLVEKVPNSAPPILTSVSSSSPQSLSSHGFHREKKDEVRESPPPLPPKSPRTTKPVRPQDFPQRLPGPGYPPETLPPPPPRRTTSASASEYHQPDMLHTKYNRPIPTVQHEKPSSSRKRSEYEGIPIKLLSPILAPTPPPDVTMESPMSDTFPIISPPPAFSTPVTPMLDRQNSTTSDKSEKKVGAPKLPLSSTISAVSSISSGKSRKSTPTDVSMGYVSPRSPPDLDISSKNSTIETEPSESVETTNEEESLMECRIIEKDSTTKTDSSPPPTAVTKSILVSKRSPIPKSVTENALYSVCNKCDGSSQNRSAGHQPANHNHTHANINVAKFDEHMPRRPILRSKSDLSHRYKKAASSFNLIGGLGFTLVHVDLNGSPQPPVHISSGCQTAMPQQPPAAFRNTAASTYQQEAVAAAAPVPRSSADLERFFDMLGLDNQSLYESTLSQNNHADLLGGTSNGRRSGGSSPVFFSSVSSIESEPRRGGSVDSGDSPIGPPKIIGTRTVGGSGDYATTSLLQSAGNNVSVVSNGVSSNSLFIQHGEPSIVERNARVIKWLYNCRKAVEMSKR